MGIGHWAWGIGHGNLLCAVLVGTFSLLKAGGMIQADANLWLIPAFFVVQSLVAILLLESVNYIEHYGIIRAQLTVKPGQRVRYERVNPLHSWNASQVASNWVLFQLQRHSDHHTYAARPYQVLRHFDESPQLPHGYALMILIATIPPLWFRVMDPRLDAWKAQAVDADQIREIVKQFA